MGLRKLYPKIGFRGGINELKAICLLWSEFTLANSEGS